MAEQRIQRRLAAILAADVVGYSRMMGADEAGTLARLNAVRAELLNPKVSEYGGRIVKTTGDGTLIESPSAVDAVQLAVDVQRAMRQRNSNTAGSQRIELRMGINVGDVIIEGDDLYGDGVNIAARLEKLAAPGGICISGTVHEHVRTKLELDFDDQGEQSLKNIAERIHVYGVQIESAKATSDSVTSSDAIFRRPAVAVLPFENIGGDPEQEYFADGLTEDIITALSLWRSFPVIARNSSFAYKGQSSDIRKVGGELGARYVVEGSVRRSGNRVRVTAQLINAETGHHVWAERYDRDLDDIFDLQDEITQRIAATVAPELERSERTRSSNVKRQDLNAWDYVQRGISLLYQFTPDGIEASQDMFRQAIDVDQNYGRAFSMLAYSHLFHVSIGISDPTSVQADLKAAIDAASHAIELDDKDSVAHRVLGIALLQVQDFDRALAEKEAAVELNPNDPSALIAVGHSLTLNGRPEEAIPFIEKGLKLNPRDPRNHVYLSFMARAQLTARHYNSAIEWAIKASNHRPTAIEPHLLLGVSYGHLGRSEDARAELETCERLHRGSTDPATWVHIYQHSSDNEHFLDGLRKAGWKD